MRRVGFTTTIPVELVYAADCVPVDLNNIFIADPRSREMVADAEREGFSQNVCAWVKGLHAALREHEITEVVGVIEGDCSQNAALLDIWRAENITVYPFSFSQKRGDEFIRDFEHELSALARALGADLGRAQELKVEFDRIRALVAKIDELAVIKGCVTSTELFDAQLVLTDFGGDPVACENSLAAKLAELEQRGSDNSRVRLGVVGVPTILDDLWDGIEDCGGRVIYHEVPHQFSLADGIGKPIAQAFAGYTYSCGALERIAEIKKQAEKRGLRGIIHYTQSFCHRQLHDILLRREMDIPVLTIEADRPGAVDGRTRTRIEAFLEQLS